MSDGTGHNVSVLFSEPKIPQFFQRGGGVMAFQRFSALQRAENSSIAAAGRHDAGYGVFQCSSASRKFLNSMSYAARMNSPNVSVLFSEPKIPQSVCDSNRLIRAKSFSALQRAENSSMGAKRLRSP